MMRKQCDGPSGYHNEARLSIQLFNFDHICYVNRETFTLKMRSFAQTFNYK